jgi:SARP family transcriptional regulator, regulator of embCAB operon
VGVGDRIQLCGEFAVLLDGRQRAGELRGLQARALLVFLVFERHRPIDRFDAIEALWGERPPPASAEAIRALLSNVRRALGRERLVGRDELRLRLPDEIWIDVEVAARAVHDAESAVALRQWQRAWLAAHVAVNVAGRPLLARWNGSWIEERRADLEQTRLRALEALAASGIGLAGTELSTARRAAKTLIEADPYRESGHRFMMQALALEGNTAQALLVFEQLRARLRDDLGVAPSQDTLRLHSELLRATSASN